MPKLLFSAYFCNPFLTSEAYAAFSWLQILLKKYNVILITNKESHEDFTKYYKDGLPENLEIISFKDSFPLKEKIHKRQFYLGYFIFNFKAFRYLKRNKKLMENVHVIFHKSPSSFRYYSSLYKLNKPFVIGPLGGGLPTPKQLKDYFKGEQILNKLRILDNYLLKLPRFKKQFSQADNILITLDYLRERFEHIKVKKITTILDTGIKMEGIFNFENQRNNKKVQILYVGKLLKPKGAELLIHAFANLYKKIENIELTIIGNGPEYDTLKRLVNTYGLTQHINVTGNLPFEEVCNRYEMANIFCFPSIKEASGNVLLEAMKYKLPIITVDNGGPKHMCPDNGTIKIEIGTSTQMIARLEDALFKLATDAELRVVMGNHNYNHCFENYSWNTLEREIIGLFSSYFN